MTEDLDNAKVPVQVADVPRLALRPKEAARALGIGERLLWSKTTSGEIPHLRIGKAVVYPVAALQEWLLQEVQNAMSRWRK